LGEGWGKERGTNTKKKRIRRKEFSGISKEKEKYACYIRLNTRERGELGAQSEGGGKPPRKKVNLA